MPVRDGRTGWSGKARGRTPDTNVSGKSDSCIVPEKQPNKGRRLSAEAVEGRRLTKGNTEHTATLRTQSRTGVSIGLLGVREAARRDKKQKFTALLHHVTVDLLRGSYYALRRKAAPGVDGMTWQEYGRDLEARLRDLHDRVHRGTYRAKPSRRTYIPKADGRRRPLGVTVLEDKIVQQALVTVLNQIYEEDFLGFSYGFRPTRGAHDALDAFWVGIMRKKVNWVLDADISRFFDTIDHGWLLKFIEHRIADRRVIRLIRKWLKAGVLEDGTRSVAVEGTPQGSVISPLLANVYLHYALDLWAHRWRGKSVYGDVIMVRYADDVVWGFQYRSEAERFLQELQERLQKFGLALHPEKTRLIEFGRYAARDRKWEGLGKPETFDFLGFTHMCGRTRNGKFQIWRKTNAKRLRSKLRELRQDLMYHRHVPIPILGSWLRAVVRGYFNYHGVPGNMASLETFRTQVIRHWLRALRRRSQRSRMTWERFGRLVERWIPSAQIKHPYPFERFYAKYPK